MSSRALLQSLSAFGVSAVGILTAPRYHLGGRAKVTDKYSQPRLVCSLIKWLRGTLAEACCGFACCLPSIAMGARRERRARRTALRPPRGGSISLLTCALSSPEGGVSARVSMPPAETRPPPSLLEPEASGAAALKPVGTSSGICCRQIVKHVGVARESGEGRCRLLVGLTCGVTVRWVARSEGTTKCTCEAPRSGIPLGHMRAVMATTGTPPRRCRRSACRRLRRRGAALPHVRRPRGVDVPAVPGSPARGRAARRPGR